MKNSYFFLLLACCCVQAQVTVRGKLIDHQTNEPIISASIGIKGKASGTISNEEGIFQLTVSKDDQVMVSCLGYQPISIPGSSLKEETLDIFLEQSEEKLEEVLVTKVPPYQMLANVITVSTARLNKPILLHTYYREFAKSNEKYSRFADGMLDYHIGGNTKKTTSELVVLQNRGVNLSTPEEEEDDLGSIIGVKNAVSAYYSMTEIYDALIKHKHYEHFDFGLKSKKEGGKEMYIISVEPKAEVEKALLKGTITFDPQTNLIYEIDLFKAPSHLQYARTVNLVIAKVTYMDAKIKVGYKMVGNNYVLSYNNRYFKIRIFNKKLSEVLESRSDLLVVNFEKDAPYDKKKRFKQKHLYDKPTSYTTKFWQQSNAIVLTADEEKIITELEKASSLSPSMP